MRRVGLVALGLVLVFGITWLGLYAGWRSEQRAIDAMGGAHVDVSYVPLGGVGLRDRLGRVGFVLDRASWLEVPGIYARGFTDVQAADIPALSHLKLIRLADTGISDSGLKYLENLTRLEKLDLSSTKVTDAGVAVLSKLKSLKQINLNDTKATPAAVKLFPPTVWVWVRNLPGAYGVPGSLRYVAPTTLAAGTDPLAGAMAVEVAYIPRGTMGTMYEYYVPGEKVGERVFYQNGKVAEERLLKNGVRQGPTRMFYDSGKVFAVFPYQHGKIDGTVQFFKETGELLGASTLVAGTGVLRQYPLAPVVPEDAELTYKDGLLDGTKRTWGRYGSAAEISCECTQVSRGTNEGWDVLISAKGNLVSSAYFHDGALHGVYREFNSDGSVDAGYPKYFVRGKAVAEEAYREAARDDAVLLRSLEDDGLAWGRQALQESRR